MKRIENCDELFAQMPWLQIVEVTEGMNGYPKNLSEAVIGFEDWRQAKWFAKESGLHTVVMTKRDGHQFWKYENPTTCPLTIGAHWYGDDYECWDRYNEWWANEKPRLAEMVLQAEDVDYLYNIANMADEIKEAFESMEEGEQVLLYKGNYIDTIPYEAMHWHDNDVTDYVIAVK